MKNFEMNLFALNCNTGSLSFQGIAADDDVEAKKISSNGPRFYLSFNFDRQKAAELGDELIRVGTMLKALKE